MLGCHEGQDTRCADTMKRRVQSSECDGKREGFGGDRAYLIDWFAKEDVEKIDEGQFVTAEIRLIGEDTFVAR